VSWLSVRICGNKENITRSLSRREPQTSDPGQGVTLGKPNEGSLGAPLQKFGALPGRANHSGFA
jgi:hypothetical protein